MDSDTTSTVPTAGETQILPVGAPPAAKDLHLFYEPAGTLRLTVRDLALIHI